MFVHLTKVLKRYLRDKGVWFWIYIDDSATLGVCATKPDAGPAEVTSFVRSAFAKFGFTLGTPKCIGPTTSFVAIGYAIDTAAGTLAVSEKRLAKMHHFIASLSGHTTVPATEVARAMGFMVSVAPVGRAPMYWAARFLPNALNAASWSDMVPWSADDTAWFHAWLQSLQPEAIFDKWTPDFTLVTDASEVGSGAVLWRGTPPWWDPEGKGVVVERLQRNWFPESLSAMVHFELETWTWAHDICSALFTPKAKILGLVDN